MDDIDGVRVEILKRLQRDGRFKLFFVSKPKREELHDGIALMRKVGNELLSDVTDVPFSVIIDTTQPGEQEQLLTDVLEGSKFSVPYHFYRAREAGKLPFIEFVKEANATSSNWEEQRLRKELNEGIGKVSRKVIELEAVLDNVTNALKELQGKAEALKCLVEKEENDSKDTTEDETKRLSEEVKRLGVRDEELSIALKMLEEMITQYDII
ncbi:hypothetical protein HDU96_002246 [Phlyctochytrium bullatum]|nr:hypothetical protein HDU96_002246 [Phlyctochytrium bullatum]